MIVGVLVILFSIWVICAIYCFYYVSKLPVYTEQSVRKEFFEPLLKIDPNNVELWASLLISEHCSTFSRKGSYLIWNNSMNLIYNGLKSSFEVKLPLSANIRQRDCSLKGLLKFQPIIDGNILDDTFNIDLDFTYFQNVVSSSLQSHQNYIYAKSPLRVRIVDIGNVNLTSPNLDALSISLNTHYMPLSRSSYRLVYDPIVYLDNFNIPSKQMVPISRNTSLPSVTLMLEVDVISWNYFVFRKILNMMVDSIEEYFPGQSEVMDEVRYWTSENRLKSLFVMQCLGWIHIIFEYYAFRDEYRFFVTSSNLSGVSLSSLYFSILKSLIVLLYLYEQQSSWIVILSVLKDLGFHAWKAIQVRKRKQEKANNSQITVHISRENDRQQEIDQQAGVHVILLLAPVIFGYSIHSYLTKNYRSWYSWIIDSGINVIYVLGFLSLLPQLYLNYRLKSVAYLPQKVFLYKIFLTFVDDITAYLLEYPWKHRLLTMMDDIIFFGFIIQWFIYPSCKNRKNEFGYRYEKDSQTFALDSSSDTDKKE